MLVELFEVLKLMGILRRKVTQLNADDHFPNMVVELSNIHEHRSKPTSASYTFQPLMSF